MQRVLAGRAKGMRLETLSGFAVRPALARVRTSLFDILAPDISDSHVLDLFAGTGSVGIEALSRGATACVFVERDAKVAALLRRNLEKTRLADRARVLVSDVLELEETAIRGTASVDPGAGRPDLVFINPPYAFWDDGVKATALWKMIASWKEHGRLAPHVRFFAEHHKKQSLLGLSLGWVVPIDVRVHGQTRLTIAVPAPAAVLAETAPSRAAGEASPPAPREAGEDARPTRAAPAARSIGEDHV
ncbi:MAG: 16S rRNA (guanine(966)-N(2))-methyltransferase RsmD [Planctomycetes bacterium]|nr:16S rRNA (guanine(966)-N(2))-methyltransferase RsmD [Planctomycetota bacterium]